MYELEYTLPIFDYWHHPPQKDKYLSYELFFAKYSYPPRRHDREDGPASEGQLQAAETRQDTCNQMLYLVQTASASLLIEVEV